MAALKLFCFILIPIVHSKPLVPVPLIPSNIIPAQSTVGIANIPAQVGTAVSKTIHYAEAPAITGYMSTLFKPDLSAFGPFQYNYQRTLLRPVKTFIPKIAKIEPNFVEVPIVPSVKDIEIAAPVFPKIRVPPIEHALYPQI